MTRRLVVICLFAGLALAGCSKVQPILTPQEFASACAQTGAGADGACASRVCQVYQAVVTDYHENMEGCYAACKERATDLETGAGPACAAKIKAEKDRCMDFCNRKFYRCNCAK